MSADALRASVTRLLERQRITRETGLWGESEAVRQVLVQVAQMAPVSSTVLIEGESGTGKELVARAIHRLSPRRGKPFIAVNVGALPETLLESELFGHEKGAFTGAAASGASAASSSATGGTLFLDEIGEIPQSTQVKLLRVLEEREVTRVGGVQAIPIDVRVVAATNRPLRESVERGQFRADLFYRLNVLRIYLPPLRERRSDIPLLVRRFVQEFSEEHEREFHGISAEAMQALVSYAWPGNVRELRNLVESMVVLATGREIGIADIPAQIRDGGGRRAAPGADGSDGAGGGTGRGAGAGVHRPEPGGDEAPARGAAAPGGRGPGGDRAGGRGDGGRPTPSGCLGREVLARAERAAVPVGGIEPARWSRWGFDPPNTVTITPGMTMVEVEKDRSSWRHVARNARESSESGRDCWTSGSGRCTGS